MHIFSLSGDTLTDTAQHAMDSRVTAVSYSHNGSMLAAADSNRKIMLFQLPGYEVCLCGQLFSYHLNIRFVIFKSISFVLRWSICRLLCLNRFGFELIKIVDIISYKSHILQLNLILASVNLHILQVLHNTVFLQKGLHI